MFQLDSQAAKLAHINVREEKHGDDPVPAYDLKIKMDVPNTFLSQLHPTLKWSLYDKAPTVDAVDDSHMPVLRYALLEPVRWKGEMKEAMITVHDANGEGAKSLVFSASVNDLLLDCRDGGTVSATFRIQAVLTGFMISQLVGQLGKDIVLSVEPEAPAPDAAGDQSERKARMRKRAADKKKKGGDVPVTGDLLQ